MIGGCMQDPQFKLKGGIVRVNIDSGMSQMVMVSARGFRHMVYCGPWFCMPGTNACESFIRLE